MTMSFPAILKRWGLLLTLCVGFLFLKLVVIELDYWGPRATRQDTDFVNVWAAGTLVNAGKPADAYDWHLHRKAEVAALGHDLPGYYFWSYPPMFLVVASVLALLPYTIAWLVWVVATVALYARTMRVIIGQRIGYLMVTAWPATAWNAYLGQNGFLTATLIGGALYCMEKRPRLAGVFLGLLTYKPQFGVLFPLILLFERRWSTLISAVLTASLCMLAATLAYGTESWAAFFHWMPQVNIHVFDYGNADLAKMHSVMGVLRYQGVPLSVAWALQGLWMVAVLVGVLWVRRRAATPEIKAAILGVGVLMASPYLYIYDLAALAIPLAFMIRLMLRDGVRGYEVSCLAGIVGLVLVFPLVKLQFGFVALLLTAFMVAMRLRPLRS